MRSLSIRRRSALVMLALAGAAPGCGGGGYGGGDGGTPPTPPTAPGAFSANVQFDAAAQRFVATWNAASGAQRYRVLLKRDEASDFAPLTDADDLSAMTLDFNFAVGFTIQWSAAALRVEACNAVGCTAAADLPLLSHLVSALAKKQTLGFPAGGSESQVAASADGNTLVVGAPFAAEDGEAGPEIDKGLVYVFARSGTTWSEQPTVLRAPNGEGFRPGSSGDQFGRSVALSADGATLAVGAPGEDGSATSTAEAEDNLVSDAGAVYIFVRNGATYDFRAYLKAQLDPSDTAMEGDFFGHAVALAADGQTLLVGAQRADPAGLPSSFNDGAAYVFTHDAGSWTQRALLGRHAAGNAGDQFGRNVAISADGSTIAVAAPFEAGDAQSTFDNPNTNAAFAGAVYVFATDDRVQWPLQAYLKAPNAQLLDNFGSAVALSGDGNTLAIGATNEDGDTTSTLNDDNDNLHNAGAVYVYTRSGSTWSATPVYLKPSSSSEGAFFGDSLSLAANGDGLAIGTRFDHSAPPSLGAVHLFVRTGASWREQVRFDEPATAVFGRDSVLSADGSTLFICAQDVRWSVDGGVHVY